MSVLATSDFYGASTYYRIPKGAGTADAARLQGVINEAEEQFCEKFAVVPADITGSIKEALKFYTFALWLKTETVQTTPLGTGAKNRLKEADNLFDKERYVTAYNRACKMMNRQDLILRLIFNY